ncbi:Uncharacterised protein [Vibrio cholerae]|nr:Uncharacterised protein [Vibrio cholerae]CSI45953.1 Uncharacterised protein [Vibrio cholerae]CSI71159.1 Uncharacterised protein [Vibrio cholerae]
MITSEVMNEMIKPAAMITICLVRPASKLSTLAWFCCSACCKSVSRIWLACLRISP